MVGVYGEGGVGENAYCILLQFEEASSLATRLGHTQLIVDLREPFFVSRSGTHTPMTNRGVGWSSFPKHKALPSNNKTGQLVDSEMVSENRTKNQSR